MPLDTGTRLGPYEIISAIGFGGMGEVYRARDTRLDRTVAIKVLPSHLAVDPQLRERFEREARAISSLNHPHICTLLDVGRQDPSTGSGQAVDFLVLEYLEGQTLADRLTAGALKVDEALRIGIQIADALDKAHRSGIVHRDLKPANVFLVRGGAASSPPTAKLLDFGLAKNSAPVVATSGLSMLPTTPPFDGAQGRPNMTAQGTILGTFQYMAPEQIEGLEADARTDIFAFGALLFEMIAGRTAFEGKTRASLLGAILKDEPPRVSAVQPIAPKALDRIVATCLAKDPDDRWQTARDLMRELKWVASGQSVEPAAAEARAPRPLISRGGWILIGLLSIATAAAGIVVGRLREAIPPAEAMRFAIPAPENLVFGGPTSGGSGTAAQLAVSPDGRQVAFVAGSQGTFQIWLRPVGALAARPLPGTDEGAFPFWSPDSRTIGFFAGGQLRKVPIAGGPPSVLCDAPSGRGGTWSRDNVILFAPATAGTGIERVSSAGGVPAAVTKLDPSTGETNHRWPHFLPDGRHFLYTATTGTCCPATKPAQIRIAALDSAEPGATLFQAESSISYASGHLLFARDDTLMAVPFDAQRRQLTGEAFPLVEHVSTEGSRYVGVAASSNGVLVYAFGGARQSVRSLTWFDRTGRTVATVGEPAAYVNLALSPDERSVAFSLGTGSPENIDIWTLDIASGVRSRLTFDPAPDTSPIWSHDGSRIVFGGSRGTKWSLRQKVVAGTADDETLLEGLGALTPTGWSSDGRFIAYTQVGQSGTPDIWALPLTGDRKPFPIVESRFQDTSATFSPDGRWVAYVSNEGGRTDVYVQPFPPTGGKHQVSKDGDSHPVWRADGRELFYLASDNTLMAVSIDASREFKTGAVQPLFQTNAIRVNSSATFAASRDGQRFLVNTRGPRSDTAAPLTVVLNWPETIQK